MQYLHIKNLEIYNPGYKDRSSIWCKIYFKMVNCSPEFELLCEIDKWRFVAFIMLEIQSKKEVPLSEDYLYRKGFDLRQRKLQKTVDSLLLTELIEIINVTDFAQERNAGVTQSRVEKSRVEKNIGDVIPTVEEVRLECDLRKNKIDPQHFVDYYQARGWMVGKNKMRDWRAALRTWEKMKNFKFEDKQVTSTRATEKPIHFEEPHYSADDLKNISNLVSETVQQMGEK